MFGRDETIEYLALSLKVGVAVRNEIDHEILRLEREEVIEFRFANQELIGGSFNRNGYQFGFDFSAPANRIGDVDSRPPCEILRSRGSLGLEVLIVQLAASFFQPQDERICLGQDTGSQYERVVHDIQPPLRLVLLVLSLSSKRSDRSRRAVGQLVALQVCS